MANLSEEEDEEEKGPPSVTKATIFSENNHSNQEQREAGCDGPHQGHKAHASANIPHLDGFVSWAGKQEGAGFSTLFGLVGQKAERPSVIGDKRSRMKENKSKRTDLRSRISSKDDILKITGIDSKLSGCHQEIKFVNRNSDWQKLLILQSRLQITTRIHMPYKKLYIWIDIYYSFYLFLLLLLLIIVIITIINFANIYISFIFYLLQKTDPAAFFQLSMLMRGYCKSMLSVQVYQQQTNKQVSK